MSDALKNIAIQAEGLISKVTNSISKYKTGITNLGLSKDSSKDNKLSTVISDLESGTIAHALPSPNPVSNDMMRYSMEFYDQKNPNASIAIGTNNAFRLGIDFRVFKYNFLEKIESATWVLSENDAKNGYIYCISEGKLYKITIFKDRAPDVMELVMGKYTLKGRIIQWADDNHPSSKLYLGLVTDKNLLIVFDTTTGVIEELATQPSSEYISYLAQPYPIISTPLSDTAMLHVFVYKDASGILKLGRTTETFRNITTENYTASNIGLYSINNIIYFSILNNNTTELYTFNRTNIVQLGNYANSNKSMYWVNNIAYGINGTSLFSSTSNTFTNLGGLRVANDKFDLFTMVNDQIIIVDKSGIYLSGDTNHLSNNPTLSYYEILGSNIHINSNKNYIAINSAVKPSIIDNYFVSMMYLVRKDDPNQYILYYNPLDYENMGLDVNLYIRIKINGEYKLSTYKINNYDYESTYNEITEFNPLDSLNVIIPLVDVSPYLDSFSSTEKIYDMWCTYSNYNIDSLYSDINKMVINKNLPVKSKGATSFGLDVTSGNYYEWYKQIRGNNGSIGSATIDELNGEIIRILYDTSRSLYYAVGYKNDDDGHSNPLLIIYNESDDDNGWQEVKWDENDDEITFYSATNLEGELYDVSWQSNSLFCVGIYYPNSNSPTGSLYIRYEFDSSGNCSRKYYMTDLIDRNPENVDGKSIIKTGNIFLSSIDNIDKIYNKIPGKYIKSSVYANGMGLYDICANDSVYVASIATSAAANSYPESYYSYGVIPPISRILGMGLLYSSNGIDWYPSSIQAGLYRSIATDGKNFIAVPFYNKDTTKYKLKFSTDGKYWSDLSTTPDEKCTTIYYQNNRWVLRTDSGIWYKTGSITSGSWTKGTTRGGDLYFLNNRWYLMNESDGGSLCYSENLSSWTVIKSSNAYYTDMAYGNGIYVATTNLSGSSSPFLYSSDGISWSYSNLAQPSSYHSLGMSVGYGNNMFVAATDSSMYYSTNGADWTACDGNGIGPATQIIYCDGEWLATNFSNSGSYHSLRNSHDGKWWNANMYDEGDDIDQHGRWISAKICNGKFYGLYGSDMFHNCHPEYAVPPKGNYQYALKIHNNELVKCFKDFTITCNNKDYKYQIAMTKYNLYYEYNNGISYSSFANGLEFEQMDIDYEYKTLIAVGASYNYDSTEKHGGVVVCVGNQKNDNNPQGPWYETSLCNEDYYKKFDKPLLSVKCVNHLWVFGSNGKGLAYFEEIEELTDQKNLTLTQSNITEGVFKTIDYRDGLWVAGRNDSPGGVYYSTDGKSWTAPSVTSMCVNDITHSDKYFVAACEFGINPPSKAPIAYSQDGKLWNFINRNDMLTKLGDGSLNHIDCDKVFSYGDYVIASPEYTGMNYVSENGYQWYYTNVYIGFSDVISNGTVVIGIGGQNYHGIYFSSSDYIASKISSSNYSIGCFYSSKFSSINFSAGCYGGNLWLLGSGSNIYYSTEAQPDSESDWTTKTAHSALTNIYKLYWYNNIYLASDESKGIFYSVDGKTSWTWSNVTQGKYKFMYSLIGQYHYAYNDDVRNTGLYYSSDGKSWTKNPSIVDVYAISNGIANDVVGAFRYGTNAYSTLGIYHSTDGKNWFKYNNGKIKKDSNRILIKKLNDVIVNIGDGYIQYMTKSNTDWKDAIVNSGVGDLSNMIFTDIEAHNDVFVLVGKADKSKDSSGNQVILVSRDGINWSDDKIYFVANSSLAGVEYVDGKFIATSEGGSTYTNSYGIYYSINASEWKSALSTSYLDSNYRFSKPVKINDYWYTTKYNPDTYNQYSTNTVYYSKDLTKFNTTETNAAPISVYDDTENNQYIVGYSDGTIRYTEESVEEYIDSDYILISGYFEGGLSTDVYNKKYIPFTYIINGSNLELDDITLDDAKRIINYDFDNYSSGYNLEVISLSGSKTPYNYTGYDSLPMTKYSFMTLQYQYYELDNKIGWFPKILLYDNEFNCEEIDLYNFILTKLLGKIHLDIKAIILYAVSDSPIPIDADVVGSYISENGKFAMKFHQIISSDLVTHLYGSNTWVEYPANGGHHNTMYYDIFYEPAGGTTYPCIVDNIDKIEKMFGGIEPKYLNRYYFDYDASVPSSGKLSSIEMNSQFEGEFYLPPVLVYEGYNYNDYIIPASDNIEKNRYFVRIYNNYERVDSEIMTITLK